MQALSAYNMPTQHENEEGRGKNNRRHKRGTRELFTDTTTTTDPNLALFRIDESHALPTHPSHVQAERVHHVLVLAELQPLQPGKIPPNVTDHLVHRLVERPGLHVPRVEGNVKPGELPAVELVRDGCELFSAFFYLIHDFARAPLSRETKCFRIEDSEGTQTVIWKRATKRDLLGVEP